MAKIVASALTLLAVWLYFVLPPRPESGLLMNILFIGVLSCASWDIDTMKRGVVKKGDEV